MIPRIAVALALFLAASGFLVAPQTQWKPGESARLNNLGVAYMNQQLFEKGLKNFQQSAEADPKLAIARLNQGVADLNLQKVDQAKAALEDALKQDAKNPNAWYNLGLLAKNTGDAPAAIDAFRRVTEIDASDRGVSARVANQSAARLGRVRIVARLPAVRRCGARPRAPQEIPVHHAK